MSEEVTRQEELFPAQELKEGDVNDISEGFDSREDRTGGAEETCEPVDETAGTAPENREEAAPVALEGNELPAEVLEISDPAGAPADPDPREDAARELLELREELTRIKERLSAEDSARRRAEIEYAEFQELYPQTTLASLPDKVWEDVKGGVPLAAAFARAERRRALLEQKAREQNAQNKKAAPAGLEGSDSPYFSPAEVRAMTPAEVRKQYDKILLSMQKWN